MSEKLEKGSTNRDEVVRLKADLALLNYYKGALSDEFGDELDAAVKSFQMDHGLTVDGVVGLPKGPTRDKIDFAIDTAFEVIPPKNPPPVVEKPDGTIKPVYWSQHKFHPRFDHLLKAPYTHLHPLDVARSVAGEKEISGSKHNPFIAHLHEHSGNLGTHSEGADYSDEVPHCASGINWSCDGGGCKKSNNALAASNDKYPGRALKKGDRVPAGAIVRIAHPGGHVTFADKEFTWTGTGTFIGYGFNQGNSIKSSGYAQSTIKTIHIVEPLPGTVLAPIGILGHKPVPATGSVGESTR